MFKWLNQPLGKSKPKAKELPKREATAPVVEVKAPKQSSSDSRRLFGLQLGKSKPKAKELPKREATAPVVEVKAPKQSSSDSRRLFGLQLGKSKPKAKELPKREAAAPVIESKAPKQSSFDSLHSLLTTAIADAEQIADSIKLSAQAEAEAEADRIITQAKLEVNEIKGKAEIAARREAENIISAANRKAEITEVEAKQKVLQFLIRASGEVEKEIKEEYKRTYSRLSISLQGLMNEGQSIEMELKGRVAKLLEGQALELRGLEAILLDPPEAVVSPIETSAPAETKLKPDISSVEKIEVPVQFEEEVMEEKIEVPVQFEEEVMEEKIEVPVQFEEEVMEEKIEVPVQLEEEVMEERKVALVELDSQAIYTGEVELIIIPPVELNLVSRLYNYLQTIPELRILYTRGSWDQGTTIIVVLDNPIPLISIISKTPDVEVSQGLLENEVIGGGGKTSSVLRGEQRAKKIRLILKEP
ncbi:hypothetical protein ACFLUR_00445 [Chloroflexota bacterium]